MRSITAIFLFICSFVSAQPDTTKLTPQFELRNADTINYVDSSGLRQGFWISFGKSYPDQGYHADQIVQTGYYLNSQPEGKWVKYWPNGAMAQRIYYKNGIAEGRYTNFYQSGNLEEDGQWWAGHPVGYVRKYYETGMISLLEEYDSSGVKTGLYERFGLDGNVTYRGYAELDSAMHNGTEKQAAEQLRNAGKMLKEDCGQFKGDLLWNGRSYVFDGANTLHRINVYRDGKLVGDAIRDSIPPLTAPTPARLDLQKCVEYNDNGKLLRDGICSKDGAMFSGKVFVYDMNGQLLSTRIFRKGRMVAELDEKTERERE